VIVLAIHSTTPRLGVAITKDGDILGELTLSPSRQHLENVTLAIKDLTQNAGIHLREVDAFGAATGPGSFSGIRVGLAVVKGLALALGKPAIGVPSLAILAWQAIGHGELAVPVIDARRQEVYAAVYRREVNDVSMIEGPYLTKLEEFPRLLDRYSDPLVVCGDRVADGFVESRVNVVRSPVDGPSPAACAALAEERLKLGDPGGVHSLMPLYIRRPDAEENRSRILLLQANA
jgi:tRNA threonylcarbamoyladenosine biosynthesis protein TsaB